MPCYNAPSAVLDILFKTFVSFPAFVFYHSVTKVNSYHVSSDTSYMYVCGSSVIRAVQFLIFSLFTTFHTTQPNQSAEIRQIFQVAVDQSRSLNHEKTKSQQKIQAKKVTHARDDKSVYQLT